MTAQLYYLGAAALAGVDGGAPVRLDGVEGRHAADVVRTRVGERILLADGTGAVADARVTEVERGAVTATVEAVTRHPQPDPRVVLVQALAKGDRDLHAIEMATELGVDEVVPWQADRSIVRWRADRAVKGARKWEQVLLAAAKQSRRARVPLLGALVDRAGLARRIATADQALILHEAAGPSLAGTAISPAGEVLIVVGPEGGIHPDELAAFDAAGAQPVRLGDTVLRTSTAGAAALSMVFGRDRWR